MKKRLRSFFFLQENGKEFIGDSERPPAVANVAELCSSALECLVFRHGRGTLPASCS